MANIVFIYLRRREDNFQWFNFSYLPTLPYI